MPTSATGVKVSTGLAAVYPMRDAVSQATKTERSILMIPEIQIVQLNSVLSVCW